MADEGDTSDEIARIRWRLAALDAERLALARELETLEQKLISAVETAFADAPVTNNSSSAEKIELFRRLFAGRPDLFPVRWENRKAGRSGYASRPKDLAHLIEVRRFIETNLRAKAAEEISAEDLDVHKRALERNSAALDDQEEFWRTEVAFHGVPSQQHLTIRLCRKSLGRFCLGSAIFHDWDPAQGSESPTHGMNVLSDIDCSSICIAFLVIEFRGPYAIEDRGEQDDQTLRDQLARVADAEGRAEMARKDLLRADQYSAFR